MAAETDDDPSAWSRTLREANEMAEALRADDWEVVTVRAGHLAPVAPDSGETDRFGLVYVAPDGVAESLPAAVDGAEFERSAAFRQRVGDDLFLLTRVEDPDERVAVLLVGALDLSRPEASDLAGAARDRGRLYSHVELLDGTHLATFRHDHPADFLPEAQ
ncbi:hypothetical protein ACFQMA_15085 [Halosimplex aquaticum]|uniref:PH domain-containing protein n=1 Tax=Halosimplex aquaticum TaxID=3026162 RepID=A0ABD5Y168_9EURY|nr:hypothetical protein [Halosimplex aquaticum]